MFQNSYSAPSLTLLYIITQLGTSNALRNYSLQRWINKSESWFRLFAVMKREFCGQMKPLFIFKPSLLGTQCACKKRKFAIELSHRAPEISQSSDKFYGSQFVHCCCKNRQRRCRQMKAKSLFFSPWLQILHLAFFHLLSSWPRIYQHLAWTAEQYKCVIWELCLL